ncbi:MAG TPA: SDR family oxidoreductase [Burkholderiales bacterium]
MKVLILGGAGMLGHELLRQLQERHETRVTLRQSLAAYASCGLFSAGNAVSDVDVCAPGRVEQVLTDFRPDVVVNAVGIVKQRPEAQDAILSIEVNSLLPHRLALDCRAVGARLIHLSTDCVFSGARGGYSESDRPDPLDLYDRSKLLGEVASSNAITLRTSMIGLGLYRKTNLIDWFLAQKGRVQGYRNAIFSGLTTAEISRVIAMLIEKHPAASGLYHLSAAPISKLDLLTKLRERLSLPVEIVPVDEPRIDRSLDSTRFRRAFSYQPPSWDRMLDELAREIGAR